MSHITVWERDPQSLGVTGDELHDGPERGPVDRKFNVLTPVGVQLAIPCLHVFGKAKV